MMDILWFFCGALAVVIAAYVDFLEHKKMRSVSLEDYNFAISINLTKIIIGLGILLCGPVGLIIILIIAGVKYCDKELFSIKIRKGKK